MTPDESWLTIEGQSIPIRMKGNRFVIEPTETVSAITRTFEVAEGEEVEDFQFVEEPEQPAAGGSSSSWTLAE